MGVREDLSGERVERFTRFVVAAAELFAEWADDDSVRHSLLRAAVYVEKVKFFRSGGSYDMAVLSQAEVLAGDPLTRVLFAAMMEVFDGEVPVRVLAGIREDVAVRRGI